MGDYNSDLVEKWFDRGIERCQYSGRLLCEELADIAPRDVRFWVSLAEFLSQKDLLSDAADAWAMAATRCSEPQERFAVLVAAAQGFLGMHYAQSRRGVKTDAWELAWDALDQAAHMEPKSVQVQQGFAVLHHGVGDVGLTLDHLALALRYCGEAELEWDFSWGGNDEYLEELLSYEPLLRAMVSHGRFEAAGRLLQAAFEADLRVVSSRDVRDDAL